MPRLVYCQEQAPGSHYYNTTQTPLASGTAKDRVRDRNSRREMYPWCRSCLSTETLCSARIYLRSPSAAVCITWVGRVQTSIGKRSMEQSAVCSAHHYPLRTVLFRSTFPDAIWQCIVLYLRARRSVLICHHVMAATNWFYWQCTVVL